MIYVALLRAVNVGGLKLPMADLRKLCDDAGFAAVETYIASGNIVFTSKATASAVQADLEKRLLKYTGKPVGVVLRTAAQIQAVLTANPFPNTAPNFTYAIFLNTAPPKDALTNVSGQSNEEIRIGQREIYVHYPTGMGRSKLKIQAAKTGTARNINTVAALAEMAAKR